MGDYKIIVDAGHGRYCYSTQWIKTIRTSWFTRKLNFKEIFEKVSLFAYLKRGGIIWVMQYLEVNQLIHCKI